MTAIAVFFRATALLVGLSWHGSLPAAMFQNLDFEGAHLPVIPAGQFGGFVPVGDALPGWTVFVGTNQQSQVLQNNFSLGSAVAGILF